MLDLTVQLSPLAVLCAGLIGSQLAGIPGALLSILIAGSLTAIVRKVVSNRREVEVESS